MQKECKNQSNKQHLYASHAWPNDADHLDHHCHPKLCKKYNVAACLFAALKVFLFVIVVVKLCCKNGKARDVAQCLSRILIVFFQCSNILMLAAVRGKIL